MRILFDQGTPAPLRGELPEHQISTAFEICWSELDNGDLLNAAEQRFDAMITTDQSLRHEQNLRGRKLAILALPTTSWPLIREHAAQVREAVNALKPGDYVALEFRS